MVETKYHLNEWDLEDRFLEDYFYCKVTLGNSKTISNSSLLFPLDAQSCKVLKVKSGRQRKIVDIVFQ